MKIMNKRDYEEKSLQRDFTLEIKQVEKKIELLSSLLAQNYLLNVILAMKF